MATQDGDFVTAEGLAKTMADAGNAALSAYPVGSIYLSVSSTSPSALFGGTWERIQDRFLLCAGSTYSAGSEGGEAEHTLTVAEMPSHTHAATGGETGTTGRRYFALTAASYASTNVLSVGGNQPHNNMPPYLAVYVWKRTA